MKSTLFALLAAVTIESVHAKGSFDKFHRRSHIHRKPRSIMMEELEPASNETETIDLTKRSSQCVFPYGDLMVAVTPESSNAGWAMSPDQPCTPGNYCPFACAPGYVMDQWDPAATTYSYPESMYGGLYCDTDGAISKPYPSRDYCKAGVGSVFARNAMSSEVSFCQTVLPGNEAMLIPTTVGGGSTTGLAVPDTSYWASTAAHYYINPPGVSADEGCVWGTDASPWGNWSPYVAGANMDGNGNTFVKIGWNPIYTDDASWNSIAPSFAVSIECVGGNCNGVPCRCDPSLDGINKCSSGSDGAGDAAFCVVTVPQGSSANIVVYDTATGAGTSSNVIKAQVNAAVSASAASSATPVPTTTTTSTSTTSSSTSTTTTTTSSTLSTTTSTSTTSSSTSSTTTSSSTTTTSTSTSTTSTSTAPTTTTTTTTSSSSTSTSTSSSTSSLFVFSVSSTLNTSRIISTVAASATYQAMYRNETTTTRAPVVTTTLLRGGAGYDNLIAAPSASATKKSGAPSMLQASPALAFAAAVIILMRL